MHPNTASRHRFCRFTVFSCKGPVMMFRVIDDQFTGIHTCGTEFIRCGTHSRRSKRTISLCTIYQAGYSANEVACAAPGGFGFFESNPVQYRPNSPSKPLDATVGCDGVVAPAPSKYILGLIADLQHPRSTLENPSREYSAAVPEPLHLAFYLFQRISTVSSYRYLDSISKPKALVQRCAETRATVLYWYKGSSV